MNSSGECGEGIQGWKRAGGAAAGQSLERWPRRCEAAAVVRAAEVVVHLDQFVPNNPFYNIPDAVRLEGRLDLEVLERVINEIVRRHEVLRTRFEVEEGEPAQVIDEWE